MSVNTKLDQWCEAVIEAGWLAALIVAPMFFNVFSSRVFEPDKISLVRTTALVMLLAWLVKLANGGRPWLPAQTNGNSTAALAGDDSRPAGRAVRLFPFILPIVLLILAYAVSTLLSVAPFVSWFGSYQRLQGTYTFFSYVIIALLTIGHLRRADQIGRLQHVIVLTSLAIAIYGVVQHYDIDPLPWGGDTTRRIAGNAGNAIFLSAYLIMAFFFTLERVYSSFSHLLDKRDSADVDLQDMPTALAGGAYLFILLVQGLAIFWTQSRGPLLGLLAGLYFFVLLLFSALRPRFYRLLTGIWVGAGVAGVLFLVLLNTTTTFSAITSIPSLGRLSTLLDLESNTAQVRILIWEGAADMMTPHAPLIKPDGEVDSYNSVRTLFGYGPEAMWVAYNPFYPPKLAHHEARNASPDRSHNETWDSLVITGALGFVAYMLLFIGIFYWALRWLGLLVNRRDFTLFAASLIVFAAAFLTIFYRFDGSWRFFGVALPAGLVLGLVLYATVAAFLHPHYRPDRADIPRQLLIVALLATIVAHFVEIHFGIAIAATRTYFWVETALLLVLGMRWARPPAFASVLELAVEEPAQEDRSTEQSLPTSRRRRRRASRPRARRAYLGNVPALPSTVMTDLLIFLTFVFIYTTNVQGLTNTTAGILFNSITKRAEGGEQIGSPGLLFLMIFTWVVAATLGMTAESLRQRRTPAIGWWLRGYALHALIVWSGWLIYGLYQARRLIPGIAGNDLDSQLDHVAGHFAVYTWLVIFWILAAGTVYAWPWLREQRLQAVGRLAVSAVTGVVAAVVAYSIVTNVNVALVKADIIYKQGQQFDSQRNWVSSVELYRRALNARKTEDHYMLFLGRSLLERAKEASAEGGFSLGENPTVDDVLNLTPEAISQMSQLELLRAAEAVLNEAQRVNPLNTDHTANLARLYRTWADLTRDDAEMRQEMLDKSVAEYELAVTLSPNAAHLWNEKANAHLARGEREEAERLYLYSLELDDLYDQTYLLLADFYERDKQYDKATEILESGIAKLETGENLRYRQNPQLYSYLGVALARDGDREGAIDVNLKILKMSPNNLGAMRNLAVLYRDLDQPEEAIGWTEKAIEKTGASRVNDIKQLRQLLVELYRKLDQPDQVLAQYEAMRQLDPEDVNVLKTLNASYVEQQDWNRAVEVLQVLSTLEPNEYRHPLALAQILNRVGQPDNALPFAQQALNLAPENLKASIDQLIANLNSGG